MVQGLRLSKAVGEVPQSLSAYCGRVCDEVTIVRLQITCFGLASHYAIGYEHPSNFQPSVTSIVLRLVKSWTLHPAKTLV